MPASAPARQWPPFALPSAHRHQPRQQPQHWRQQGVPLEDEVRIRSFPHECQHWHQQGQQQDQEILGQEEGRLSSDGMFNFTSVFGGFQLSVVVAAVGTSRQYGDGGGAPSGDVAGCDCDPIGEGKGRAGCGWKRHRACM